MDYEVVIPTTKKDYNKIPFLIKSIKRYLTPKPRAINIIHSGEFDRHKYIDIDCVLNFTVINTYHENKVLNLDKRLATGFKRPEWIYQQFIKLFQDITDTNLYLVMDSDLILNKKINIFNKDEKPLFFLGVDQNHKPYFNYSLNFFGFGREYNHSFISEIMMFDKEISNFLLNDFIKNIYMNHKYVNVPFYNRKEIISDLYELTCQQANDSFIPADYEIFGNYIEKFFPNKYEKIHIRTNLEGKHAEWTDKELKDYVKRMKELDQHDMFTAHTWI